MNHRDDPFEHFGTFPNGITPQVLGSLEAAVAEIPFVDNVFYVGKPDLGQTDRDGDGLADETEIDLIPLGFHPFEENGAELRRLSSSALEVDSALEGLTITFPDFRVNPAEFRVWHTYPISLERSSDLSNWENVPEDFQLNSLGALQWPVRPDTVSGKSFYRLRVDP